MKDIAAKGHRGDGVQIYSERKYTASESDSKTNQQG